MKNRPLVDGQTLAKLVHLSYGTIRQYNRLPGCPVIRWSNVNRYDVDEYLAWLESNGPAKARKKLAKDLRAKHGMEVRL